MKIRILVACGATLLASLTAPAQPRKPQGTPAGTPVATLKSVEGNVLVSGEAGLGSADSKSRLVESSRVITTANATAVVEYDDGCEVKLEPNQRLEIDSDKPCKERVVQAESILKEPAGLMLAGGAGAAGGAAAAALTGSLGAGVVGVAGVAGVAAIGIARGDRNTSPN